MKKISVIIVTYNSKEEIIPCVESVSLNQFESSDIEIVIIDNNSTDGTFEILNKLNYHHIKIFRNDNNVGYTRAVNQGIKYSTGDYLFLLNPDTVLKHNCIKLLCEFLESSDEYAAAAPVMYYPDGKLQYSVRNFPDYWKMFCEFSLLSRIFPRTRLFGSWKAKYIDYTKSQDVQQPMAAALMIKKTVALKIGSMDERFRMFFNDVDLCKRIYDNGFRIRLISDAVLTHIHGASIKIQRSEMIKIWNRDCIAYFNKHFGDGFKIRMLALFLKMSGAVRIFFSKT
jgi:GT2 family glycosyltransferase